VRTCMFIFACVRLHVFLPSSTRIFLPLVQPRNRWASTVSSRQHARLFGRVPTAACCCASRAAIEVSPFSFCYAHAESKRIVALMHGMQPQSPSPVHKDCIDCFVLVAVDNDARRWCDPLLCSRLNAWVHQRVGRKRVAILSHQHSTRQMRLEEQKKGGTRSSRCWQRFADRCRVCTSTVVASTHRLIEAPHMLRMTCVASRYSW
jgi:hypothetical protein